MPRGALVVLVMSLSVGSACSSSSTPGSVADSGAPDTGGYDAGGLDAGGGDDASDAAPPPADSGDGGACSPSPAWETPLTRVDTPGPQRSQSPLIGFDAAGNALAVWEQGNTIGLTALWSATRSAQGTWSTPVRVDAALATQPDASAGSQAPLHASLAVAANGTAIAAWQEETNGSFSLPYAAVYDGSTWGQPRLLHPSVAPSQPPSSNDPRVAILPNGDAIIAFAFDDGASSTNPDFGQQIYVDRYTGGTWTGPGRLSAYGGNDHASGSPDVGIDAAGNGVVVWDQDEGGHRVFVSRVAVGSTSGSLPGLLDTTASAAGKAPHVAVDASGNATAVWVNEGSTVGAYASRLPSGSVQGTEVQIDTAAPSPPDAGFPLVAVDANGNVTAAWREANGDPRTIWANRFSGGSWTSAVALETNDSGATSPALGLDDAGNAMVLWSAGAGIKASFFAFATTKWGSSVVLSAATAANTDNPNVALAHGCPRAIAVWKEFGGPTGGGGDEINSALFQ